MNVALAKRWRAITLASMATLLVLAVAWRAASGVDFADVLWLAFLAVPLAAPLPGIWRSQRRSFRWATLCVTPFVIAGLTEAVALPGTRVWSAALLVVALLWFVSLVAFLRVTAQS